MENELHHHESEPVEESPQKVSRENPQRDWFMPASIFVSAIIIGASLVYYGNTMRGTSPSVESPPATAKQDAAIAALQNKVVSTNGVTLPVRWGDLGKQMVTTGVINESQFYALYKQNGGLSSDMNALLDNADNGNIVITPQNSGVLLNLLWAVGLGNKNLVLTSGPMQDSKYGGAKNFASTGGWTLANGNVMDHYSAHQFITLTSDQQALVERVAKNIYRPCCGNATYFPDCNHGMAMLGLLELMASQNVSEADMYKAALAVNSYWFPDTYLTIARYFQSKNVDWSAVDPKTALGSAYSSAQGYQQIQSQVTPVQTQSSGSCAVKK